MMWRIEAAFIPVGYLTIADSTPDGQVYVLDYPYAGVSNEISSRLTEKSYHMAFYCMMKSIGADIDAEISSARGRADAVLMTSKFVYVIEFKADRTADEALAQIREKGYCEQYAGNGVLSAFEFKYSPTRGRIKLPVAFAAAYQDALFSAVTPDNYQDFLL